MLESEIYQESFIGVVVDEVHCLTEWDSSSNNKIVQLFVLFVCVIFVTRNFNYAILTQGDLRHHMEFLAVNRRRLSSRFARSSGSG